jgi:hypothetical protein
MYDRQVLHSMACCSWISRLHSAGSVPSYIYIKQRLATSDIPGSIQYATLPVDGMI